VSAPRVSCASVSVHQRAADHVQDTSLDAGKEARERLLRRLRGGWRGRERMRRDEGQEDGRHARACSAEDDSGMYAWHAGERSKAGTDRPAPVTTIRPSLN
jgi:hypothetical protein